MAKRLSKEQAREFLKKCEAEVRLQSYEAAVAFLLNKKELITSEPYEGETPEEAHKRAYFARLVYDGFERAANAIFGEKSRAMRYFILDLIQKIKSGEFERDLEAYENEGESAELGDLGQIVENMFENQTGVFTTNAN